MLDQKILKISAKCALLESFAKINQLTTDIRTSILKEMTLCELLNNCFYGSIDNTFSEENITKYVSEAFSDASSNMNQSLGNLELHKFVDKVLTENKDLKVKNFYKILGDKHPTIVESAIKGLGYIAYNTMFQKNKDNPALHESQIKEQSAKFAALFCESLANRALLNDSFNIYDLALNECVNWSNRYHNQVKENQKKV